ncbi:MAG: hypothetical protein IPH06_03485 [Alphaproteobacteria bacterium]|nr:hypothetical protein [Alphaproteobacteria bacterium]QQS57101.1 MAG: hypothetical protein IPN28_12740 [Alphaproteobacteria bacterium]
MISKNFSALFLLVFMGASLALCGVYMNATLKGVERPTFQSIWVGTWAPAFEKALGEALPISVPARNFWGSAEYDLFNEGRKGVIVGADGWLFTDEEFSCLPKADAHMATNLDYIKSVHQTLKAKNIALVAAIIPAKVRVYKEHMGVQAVPACREGVYALTVETLTQAGIDTVSLLPVFEKAANKDSLFLKTDTHWTPEGARLAAQDITAYLKGKFTSLPAKSFATKAGEGQEHKGDLLRYTPGVEIEKIPHDVLNQYTTEQVQDAAQTDAASSLFGDDVPLAALVGTSYSANPLWNFPGFLKEGLNSDILDASDEGLGPFTVMEKYLNGDSYKNAAPVVVVWEIPERYMTTKPEYKH